MADIYTRKGLGGLFLAALAHASGATAAQAAADKATEGLAHLNDRVQALSESLAANENVDAAQAAELAEIAGDLDDLAGTLTSTNVVADVQPAPETATAAAVTNGEIEGVEPAPQA